METRIEVKDFTRAGYKEVVIYHTWRVAILNYIDELLPEKIDNFQAHLNTDEVFVLLEGRCILYTAEVQDSQLVDIEGLDMVKGKIYNMKKGVYHTHTLSDDAKVLIVENDDTCLENSPKIIIDTEINKQLVAIRNDLWRHHTRP
ncbi:MAG: hypothetical protein EA374_00580 [Acholeplasmatales bacterium]|nr:MAG: hypothetical protein EA374_00580 [Acholeplasmatales bacterium]